MIYLSYSLLDSFLTKQWCPLRSCSSDGGYPTSLFLGGRQRQESGVLMWIDMLLLVKRYAYSFSVAYLFLFLTTHPTLLDEVLHVSSSLQSALLQGSIFAHRLNMFFERGFYLRPKWL